MIKKHEYIPLLVKLKIYYYCSRCGNEIKLGSFYKAMDEIVIAASVEDGKLICSTCRDKPLGDKE